MEAPVDYVALEPLKVGERQYQPADRFERERHLQRGELDFRTLKMLEEQKRFAPLTRETYARARIHRPADFAPPEGRGWVTAELVARGVIDAADAPAAKPAPAAPKHATVGPVEGEAIPYKGYLVVPQKNGRFTIFSVKNAAGELMRAKGFKTQDRAQAYVDGLPPLPHLIPRAIEALPTDEWSDEDSEIFLAWFRTLPDGPEPVYAISNPLVAEAFRVARDTRLEPASTDSSASGTPDAEQESGHGGDVQPEPQ